MDWTSTAYDAVSDVVESGVQWRSNFEIGSRVLEVDKVADTKVDMVTDMEVDMVADMKVDMVADMKVDIFLGISW